MKRVSRLGYRSIKREIILPTHHSPLTGSSLGRSHDIAATQNQRNRFILDRCGKAPLEFIFDRPHQLGQQAQRRPHPPAMVLAAVWGYVKERVVFLFLSRSNESKGTPLTREQHQHLAPGELLVLTADEGDKA